MLHLDFQLSNCKLNLVNNLWVVAKILITKNWKLEETPSQWNWRVKCQNLLLMNKLIAMKKVRNGSEVALYAFCKIWQKLFFIGKMWVQRIVSLIKF